LLLVLEVKEERASFEVRQRLTGQRSNLDLQLRHRRGGQKGKKWGKECDVTQSLTRQG